jgi:hypothetical protein
LNTKASLVEFYQKGLGAFVLHDAIGFSLKKAVEVI